jgi:hypothetical protein
MRRRILWMLPVAVAAAGTAVALAGGGSVSYTNVPSADVKATGYAPPDVAAGGFGKNEGDNEITGVHVSNGDPGPEGLLGAQIPNLWNSSGKWRWFYTQQHGDNFTWQVVLASRAHGENEG